MRRIAVGLMLLAGVGCLEGCLGGFKNKILVISQDPKTIKTVVRVKFVLDQKSFEIESQSQLGRYDLEEQLVMQPLSFVSSKECNQDFPAIWRAIECRFNTSEQFTQFAHFDVFYLASMTYGEYVKAKKQPQAKGGYWYYELRDIAKNTDKVSWIHARVNLQSLLDDQLNKMPETCSSGYTTDQPLVRNLGLTIVLDKKGTYMVTDVSSNLACTSKHPSRSHNPWA